MRLPLAVAGVFILVAPAAAQVFTPLPVTGYTQDVIADAVGTPSATTTVGFDSDPNNHLNLHNVFFQQGYNTGGSSNGVPASGTVVTSASRSYQLGPISGDNSLFLTQVNPTGTLTLVTPVRDAALSLLLATGNDDVAPLGVSSSTLNVNWSNGQSSTFAYTAYDWGKQPSAFAPNSGEAIGGLDRIDRLTGQLNDGGSTVSLYYYDVDLTADPNYQAGALVASVAVIRPLPSNDLLTLNVMGLSGAVSVPEPSSLALLGVAVGIAACRRRRMRR